MNQLALFGDEVMASCATVARKVRSGGSSNPIVFRDYDSFMAKFADNPKTTDECWTPEDVYNAVVEYVGTITDMSGRQILRPFYPGGDYLNAEYPDDGIVIDNPPFSMFTSIVQFYTRERIPFFLFGPGMSIMSAAPYCTCVFISETLRFTNGASVRVNFASNLFGDTIATTAPLLDRLIRKCPSQDTKANLPNYEYPPEVVSASDLQTICRGGIEFALRRGECMILRTLDNHPKKNLFGNHLLTTCANGEAKAKAKAKDIKYIELSERERKIIGRL